MKRRNYSSQFKAQLAMEHLSGSKTRAEILREHTLSPALFDKWERQFKEKAHLVFDDGVRKDNNQEKIEKLQQIIGKQAVEMDFLKRGLRLD